MCKRLQEGQSAEQVSVFRSLECVSIMPAWSGDTMIAPLIRIQMLGSFNVQQGERQITRFRYQKAAALLAYLAFYHTRMHPREELIERLWPEFSPDAGRNNLSNILSSLRHQLES